MGDVFDYNGPMLMVTTILHKPECSVDETLVAYDDVIREVQEKGISSQEMKPLKVKLRSDYYSTLEAGMGGYMPRFGLMHYLACFTLFDGDPTLVNSILDGFMSVMPAQAQAAAQKYLVRTNRAIVERRPVAQAATGAA
jgi:predicted Zn-dependent peptidase